MLQYYTLMRTKNKMKDYEVESIRGMVGGCRGVFYKGIGEKIGLT